MRVQQWVLEFATPRAGDLEVFRECRQKRELGLGVVNPRTAEIEPPEFIVARVKEALNYFEPSQIFLNPDCGFGTFAERPVATPEVAFRKLRSIRQAAEQLRREFGTA
jgi:5-methyltetrahydropteroyltriglutamate--homocysteine methyltransferase